MSGHEIAPRQRDHAEDHVDHPPAAFLGQRALQRAGIGEQLGRLVERSTPPQQLGEQVDRSQCLLRHASLAGPLDDLTADTLGAGHVAHLQHRHGATGTDPGEQPVVAGPLGDGGGALGESECLGVLTIGAGVAGMHVVGGRELCFGNHFGRRRDPLVRPEQPQATLAREATLPPPLVESASERKRVPGAPPRH